VELGFSRPLPDRTMLLPDTRTRSQPVRNFPRKLSVTAVFTGTLLVASVAFAAWTASGTGQGYAKATTADAVTTLDASASTVAQLYPGGSGDVKVTVSNPNDYPVRLTSIAGNGTITSDKGAACDASTGVTFTDQTGAFDVPANDSATFTLSGAVAMSNASDNSCQGAVFTIPVSLGGASS
jgi:hypothetical protein